MLIYNPIFDVYHSAFRLLRILSKIQDDIVIDKLRIFDFYLAFPQEITKMRLTSEMVKFRKYFHEMINPYEKIYDKKRLLERMRPVQIGALHLLLSSQLIEKDNYEERVVKRTEKKLSESIQDLINQRNIEDEFTINIISQYLNKINLNGPDGLKDRTNLIEWKYDAV